MKEMRIGIPARLAMGAVALVLMVASGFAIVLALRSLTPAEYFAVADPVTGAMRCSALAVLAVLPVFVGPPLVSARRLQVASVASVMAVPALFLYACFVRDLDAAKSRVSTGSQVVETACGSIEYASIGEGPVLLVVHGAGGGFDQALDLARDFLGGGYRIVAPSRFGYLGTPLPADASPQAQADAHACLLDALNIDRAAVVGVSAGGPSSLQFALRHSQRTEALVLLVPLAYAPGEAIPLSSLKRFMVEHAVKSDLLYWAAMTLAPNVVIGTILGTPPQVVRRGGPFERANVAMMMRHILPISRRAQGLENEARIAASLERYELERIAAPTLVVSVEDDGYGTFVPAQYTARHIPGARFVGYRSGGHLLVGHRAEVEDELNAFLRGTSRIRLGGR